MKALIIEQPFLPKCCSNCDQKLEEWYAWISEKLDSTTPRRTQHRRKLPPWITPGTSNLMNRLFIVKKVYEKHPNSISKRYRYELKNNEIDNALAEDLVAYQEKLLASKSG